MTSSGHATATCEHCDGSLPHRHDAALGAARVRSQSRALAGWAGVRAGLLLVVVLAVVELTSADGVSAARAGLLSLAGAVAWALVTVVAILVAGSAHRPDRRGTAPRALALGGIASAAATPVLALAVALLFRPDVTAAPLGTAWAAWWPAAVWAGTGWLAATLSADVVGAIRLRSLLLVPDRRGEQARAAVADGAPDHARHLLGSTARALTFAAWTAALGLLPVLVVVAVPLHASLAVYLATARMTSPERSPGSRLRG